MFSGKSEKPSGQTLLLFQTYYGIRQDWLRDGEGEMLLQSALGFGVDRERVVDSGTAPPNAGLWEALTWDDPQAMVIRSQAKLIEVLQNEIQRLREENAQLRKGKT